MLIDWFTVLAQIVNFLILMWLLKRFLYKPILDAIDAREKRISNVLNETELSQKMAEQKQDDLAKKNSIFVAKQSSLLEKAQTKAELIKKEMLEDAIKEVAEKRKQWLLDLQQEQRYLGQEIAHRTQQEVFQVARKALRDLSDIDLETHIIHIFIKRLEQLGPQQRQQFLNSTESNLIIRSAMNLTVENKKKLQQTVAKVFSTHLPVRFEVNEKLVSGIEMVGAGHKFSWNIDEYLSSLEDTIATLVASKITQDEPQPETDGGS